MRNRIGLLTLPLDTNFGGILQITALYQAVNDLGFDPIYINKHSLRSPFRRLAGFVLERFPGQNIAGVRSYAVAARRHRKFILGQMPNQTRLVRTGKEIAGELQRLGVGTVVVGSDQVWRLDYARDKGELNYFLSFGGTDLKRVSYAASFGRSEWVNEGETKRVSAALSRFSHVSVRETSGVTICRETLGRDDAVHVVDPTLLLDASFYEELAPIGETPGGVLTYVLDHVDQVNAIAKSASVYLDDGMGITNLRTQQENLSVREWLQHFRRASFVVTDSFHGMVFSIIFKKPFLVVPNADRGAERFTSLLAGLELGQRLVNPYDDSTAIRSRVEASIDFDAVAERQNSLRRHSLLFLRNALS